MTKSDTNNIDVVPNTEVDYKKLGINTKSKGFRRFYNAGLLNNIDESFISEVQNYWRGYYGKNIDPTFHLAFMNHTGKKEVRLIPSTEMWNEIIPFFNDMNIRVGYSDKNIYDTLIYPENSAETVLKRVRGHYFDSNNNNIDNINAYKLLVEIKEDLIIKPSDSDNGTGIAKLNHLQGEIYLDGRNVTIWELEEFYGFNFTVQKVIEQHHVMATPHPSSVNTLRMVTFRWDKKIHHLLTYARFGGNNNVKDHAISGGVSVGVTDSGQLMDFAIDTHCNIHTHHPTTNYDFSNKAQVPNYPDFVNYVKSLHKRILHHDYVSWDIAVGMNGQPIFIEANFRGTSWRYQLVSQKPIFGALTDEVLKYLSNELEINKFSRNIKSTLPLLKEQNKQLIEKSKVLKKEKKHIEKEYNRLKKVNKELLVQKKKVMSSNSHLRHKLNSQQKKVNTLQKEYSNILNSNSWKITLPMRKIGQINKRLFKNNKL